VRPLLEHADVNEQTDPTTRAHDCGPAMQMLSPLLVADQAVIDELLGMVDEVLTAAERDLPGLLWEDRHE
jgi:hypothetical protein